MIVEIGAEAAQFPEKEYISGIAVAVWGRLFIGKPEAKKDKSGDIWTSFCSVIWPLLVWCVILMEFRSAKSSKLLVFD
jgi:hypothetical protein